MKAIKKQFLFSEGSLAILDNLKERTNSASWAEVLRNALFFYWWLVRFIIKGGEVYSLDKDGTPSKVVLPNIKQ